MTEVVNVRFRNKGKVYYFEPAGLKILAGQAVIVETAKGVELGDCTCGNHEVEDERVVQPLRPVLRVATDADKAAAEQNMKKEESAFKVFQQKIQEHKLDMKLVDVEYNFEGSKIMFFFTSDGRVDFRELVKDLASIFRTRIELRQIGVRDEAKMLGGLGICGRPFCCSTFLEEFQPVSIKMAKTQSLSLNPTKISGTCGRLMCCLKYEQNAYEHLIKNTPKAQTEVETPMGKGVVTETNLMRQTVKVRLANQSEDALKVFKVSELGEGAQQRYEEEQRLVREAEQKKLSEISSFASSEAAADNKPAEENRRKSENNRRRHRGGENRQPKQEKPDNQPKPEKREKPDRPERADKNEKREKPPRADKQDNAPKPARDNQRHGGKPKPEKAPDAESKQEKSPEQKKSGGNFRRRPRRRPQGGDKPKQDNGGNSNQ